VADNLCIGEPGAGVEHRKEPLLPCSQTVCRPFGVPWEELLLHSSIAITSAAYRNYMSDNEPRVQGGKALDERVRRSICFFNSLLHFTNYFWRTWKISAYSSARMRQAVEVTFIGQQLV